MTLVDVMWKCRELIKDISPILVLIHHNYIGIVV